MRALFLSLIFASPLALAAPVPPSSVGGQETGVVVRTFKELAPFTLMAEGVGANQPESRHFREGLIGTYYQIGEHLSAGIFYRRAYGLRHNDDWIAEQGIWKWENTNSRGEDSLVLDATARALIDFLPGRNWTIELKSRFSNNYFNNQQNLTLRPGLTYFWLKDGAAFMNFFLQYEFGLPLNYDGRALNEHWLYAGGLYHLSARVDLGAFVANHWEQWRTSKIYSERHGRTYEISESTTALMTLLIFQL